MQQTVEGGHRTHIGEESQFLTHGEQTRLWADGQSGIVVEAQIAYGSEEHGIGSHTHLMGAVGIGITTDIDGMGATDGGLVFKLMSVFSFISLPFFLATDFRTSGLLSLVLISPFSRVVRC